MISVYFFSATSFNEMLKLPVLITHFKDHKEDNKGLGFGFFLFSHYSLEDRNDQDAEKDSQLPFNSSQFPPALSIVSIVPSTAIMKITKPVCSEINSLSIYLDLFISSDYIANIWQPPRMC